MAQSRIARWRWWGLVIGFGVPPLLYGLFIVFLQVPEVRWDPLRPKEIAATYGNALELLRQQPSRPENGVEAIGKLEALRAEDPLNPLIHALLGQAWRAQGRRAEAMAATKLALELDPTLGEAWYNLSCDQAFLLDEASSAALASPARLTLREEALTSLRRAQDSGFDVRAALRTDKTLEKLRNDPRIQVFLAGGWSIPESVRSAAVRIERLEGEALSQWISLEQTPPSRGSSRPRNEKRFPPLGPRVEGRIAVGAQLVMRIELTVMDLPVVERAGALEPDLQGLSGELRWRGETELPQLQRIAAPIFEWQGTYTEVSDGGPSGGAPSTVKGWKRYSFLHIVQARAPGQVQLGPWDVTLMGVSVPLSLGTQASSVLTIVPPELLPGLRLRRDGGTSEADERENAAPLRPGEAFFWQVPGRP